MILVRSAPAPDIGWERFPADLNRQELLLGAPRWTPDKAVLKRVKTVGEKIVHNESLCGRPGVAIENDLRKEAVDVRKHFRHEIFTELPPIIAKSIGML